MHQQVLSLLERMGDVPDCAGMRRKVGFQYDMQADTARDIADEMVGCLMLLWLWQTTWCFGSCPMAYKYLHTE